MPIPLLWSAIRRPGGLWAILFLTSHGWGLIGSIDISINKAFTLRAFDISTKDLAIHSQSDGQFLGIHVSEHGRVMVCAGGIPLKRDGKIVGAVGVSGGSGQQDHTAAEAGAQAF